MLNIAEPVPTIPEFVNSNSQLCLGIPSYSGMAQKRNSQEFPGIPESDNKKELVGIPRNSREFLGIPELKHAAVILFRDVEHSGTSSAPGINNH